jgi:uncharacterized phiE125 gp8 family phage protein
MKFKTTTAVATEPVTLDQARQHLRLDTFAGLHEDDDLVTILITAAREWCEQYTRLALAEQTITAVADEFPIGRIYLPLSPAREITSIQYYNSDNTLTTWPDTSYEYDEFDDSVSFIAGQAYPNSYSRNNAVKIVYSAGYNEDFPLPMPIYQAMLLIIGHLYKNREEVDLNNLQNLPMGVTTLLQPYRRGLGL